MRIHIPNVLTLFNLLCGSIAAIFVIQNNFVIGAIFVFLGIFFDFFDGFVARKLKVQSALGIQLDSLADMVTSGLVPGLVLFGLFRLGGPDWQELNSNPAFGVEVSFSIHDLFPLLGLLVTLASAYRLAKFNLDEDQQSYFKGLPTPANTLLIMSLPLIMEFQNNDIMNAIILNKWFLVTITLLSCYLLNSNIKLFALKFNDWNFKSNATRYIFIILSLVLLIVLHFAAIPLIVAIYILMSLLDSFTTN